MPSKLHDEGLRISNKYRTKALVEYQAECGGGSQSGAICPSSCNPTCPPVKPCPDPKGRKPGFNCPPKGKCYDAACKCKPHYAEYHPRIVHPSQRPFITSLQVQEVRPSMNLRTIKNRDIPGIDFVQQVINAQPAKDESPIANRCPPEPPRKRGLDLEVELRSSKLLPACTCMKRDGLQDECSRRGCGIPECRMNPPQCVPSGGPGPYVPNLSDIFKQAANPQQPAGDSTSPGGAVNDTEDAGSVTSSICSNPNCPAKERCCSNSTAASICSNPDCPAKKKLSSHSITASICSNPDCPAKRKRSSHSIAASICSNPDCPAKRKRSVHSIAASICSNPNCPARQKCSSDSVTESICTNPKCPARKKCSSTVVAPSICRNSKCPARKVSSYRRVLSPIYSSPNCPSTIKKNKGIDGQNSCPNPNCPGKKRIPLSESAKELQLLKQFVSLCCNPECQARSNMSDKGSGRHKKQKGNCQREKVKSSRHREPFSHIHKAEVPCPFCMT